MTTLAANDEDDDLVGSHTILLKDLLGVAKDGLDYVETWVSLKSPNAKKEVDAEEAVTAPEASSPPTKEDARAPEEEAPGPPRPHVRFSGYEAPRQAAEPCAVFRLAPR